MMRQVTMTAGGIALLALLVSGCATGSSRPGQAKATTAVASVVAPVPAPPPAGRSGDDAAISMLSAFAAPIVPAAAGEAPPSELDFLIARYSSQYGVPERLVRRVIVRESRYNASARNGPYWGLMQISHGTASTMGYRGHASGLLDAETNLRYAVKYLAGAYMVARGNEDQAVRFYASGYYYDAKRAGLLEETGLR